MFYNNIQIHNLGPIKNTNIQLRNLTVFVGQNNTGKTYLLSCLYFFQSSDFKKILPDIIKKNVENFNFQDKNFLNNSQEILINILKDIESLDIFSIMNFNTNHTSKSSFLFDIPQLKKSDILVIIEYFNSNPYVKSLIQTLFDSKKNKTIFELLNLPNNEKFQKEENYEKLSKFLVSVFNQKSAHEIFLKSFIFKFFNLSLDEDSKNSYLFPVERAGINKFFYESITKLTDTNIALKSIIEFKVKLNNDTLKDKFEKTEFYSIARELEENLFNGGKIKNEKVSENNSQIVFYNKNEEKFTLENFSSSINELSIFILYLKYYAEKEHVIFIDEPELSLHPDSQRILVRYLSQLSKMGLKFIIITHSDYIVKELNNLICINQFSEKEFSYLNTYYNNETKISFEDTIVYSIFESNNETIIEKAHESKYGYEEKLFTKAINSITSDSNAIFSLLESSDEKININLKELYAE